MGFGAFVAKPRPAAVFAPHQLRHIGPAPLALARPDCPFRVHRRPFPLSLRNRIV